MKPICYTAFALYLLFYITSSRAASNVSLVCPCSATASELTAVAIKAGVINKGTSTSGDLRITLGSRASITETSFFYRALAYLPQPLESGQSHSAETILKAGLSPSGSSTVLLNLYLQENVDGSWVVRDSVRLDPSVTLPEVGGDSAGLNLFFEGSPVLTPADGSATLLIPKIVNAGPDPVMLKDVVIGHFKTAEFWGQSYRFGSTLQANLSVPGFSSVENIELTGSYDAPEADYPFTSISISDENGFTQLWQTIENRSGPVAARALDVDSIDFIADADGDGVSDYNERLTESDPLDANSKYENVIMEVMVLYTPGVSAKYSGEPNALFIQDIEWSNQALSNSGVSARFRLIDSREVNYADVASSQTALDAIQSQTGVFEGIDQIRSDVGADLLALYIEENTDTDVCGLGLLTAENDDGDLAFSQRPSIASVIVAGCRDQTLAHELGHNLGLAHSLRNDTSKTGTFEWSRGHGVDTEFTTIMAYNSDYEYYGPDIQYFSNPSVMCNGYPCGISIGDDMAADAAQSIRTTMIQIANIAGAPLITDPDNDGISDINDNCRFASNASQLDSDNDSAGDECDNDDDNDTLSDEMELSLGTDPKNADTDGDRIPDNEEILYGTNPSLGDSDADGFDDYLERSLGSDPTKKDCPKPLCESGSWIYKSDRN